MKYLPLFILCQLICVPLTALGLVICLWPALARISWLWWSKDGVPAGSWWQTYDYTALRNPVDNFKFLPVVFGLNRPLWYHTWIWTVDGYSEQLYWKAGWESDGQICLSAGAGRGY